VCDQKRHGKQNVGGVKARLHMTWIGVKKCEHIWALGFQLFVWKQLLVGSVFNHACYVCCLVFCVLQIFAILGNLGVFER